MRSRDVRALLVDPALFGAHYDAALSRALNDAGVAVEWVTRPLRAAEPELPGLTNRRQLYYRGEAAASVRHAGPTAKLRKGLSHVAGCMRLLRHVKVVRPDVVHLQWIVVPFVDRLLVRRLRAFCPVVFTVHDLSPYNASASSRLQILGFAGVLREVSALIAHTEPTREALIAKGFDPRRVVHIPHGPMRLAPEAPGPAPMWTPERRWRVVLFGKLQPYKGVDLLVEALGRLAPSVLAQLEVIVAGEPMMDMSAIEQRVVQLGLERVLALRLKRLSDAEVHELLDTADAFVFPYREVEASGVLYLVAEYGRWMIASDLGAFRDLIESGVNGDRIEAADVEALAAAIQSSIGRAPRTLASQSLPTWAEIAAATKRLYLDLIKGWQA